MSEEHPHDTLIRGTLKQAENAAAEMRRVLPQAVLDQLDLSTITLREGTTVADDLSDRRTDLVFDIMLRNGRPALALVLYEHQSSVDTFMPWRMLEYMVRLWSDWIREQKAAEVQVTALPVIIPVVLYHGRSRWTASTRFAELFNVSDETLKALEPHLPSFTFIFQSLRERPEPELRAEVEPLPAMLALTLLMFRSLQRTRAPIQALVRWAPLINRLLAHPNGRHNINLAFSDIEAVLPAIDLNAAAEAIKPTLDKPAQEEVMEIRNIYARARYERGREAGRAEGVAQGKRELLDRILKRRFPDEAEAARALYAEASLEDLDRYFDRALEAASFNEIFGA